MGVDSENDGVWAGVCCPFGSGVAQASRKCECGNVSVFGVLRLASGNVTDLGVEEGLGRCQSVDLAHDPR
jgi:hypothetical protein